jgi:ABC-2 type transport system permease protein
MPRSGNAIERSIVKGRHSENQVPCFLVGMPIVFLLLFVYVFGGQLSHGLGSALAGSHVGRDGYLNYVTPGILLQTVAAAVLGTAIVPAMDMTGGIIDRFRTMAIARSSVLTGHVLAALIQTMAGLAIVIGFAVALGFRPAARVLSAGGDRDARTVRLSLV